MSIYVHFQILSISGDSHITIFPTLLFFKQLMLEKLVHVTYKMWLMELPSNVIWAET